MPDSARAYVEFVDREEVRCVELSREAVCRIGRAEQNTVVLPDDLVSRFHAAIQTNDVAQFWLVDLGSHNGTFLNGRRVTVPVVLRDGNWIDIGDHRLTFRQEVQTPVEPARGRTTRRFLALRTVSVLVADIHESTRLWNLAPDVTAEAMAAFHQETGSFLKQEDVWSQKFSGDGVMALWLHEESAGEPLALQRKIVRGVLGIEEITNGLNRRFALPFPLRVGVGMDSGAAVLGNFGSAAEADHTALGDAVNRAHRLEAATRALHCDILVSAPVHGQWQELLPGVAFRPEQVELKGFPEPTPAYAGTFAQLRKIFGP